MRIKKKTINTLIANQLKLQRELARVCSSLGVRGRCSVPRANEYALRGADKGELLLSLQTDTSVQLKVIRRELEQKSKKNPFRTVDEKPIKRKSDSAASELNLISFG